MLTIRVFALSALIAILGSVQIGHAGTSAVCVERSNKTISDPASDGSFCSATSDGSGTAQAKAKNAGSEADTSVTTGGKGSANASGGGSIEVFATGGGVAKGTSTNGSNSYVEADNHGVANATTKDGGQTDAVASAACKVTASASGSGSYAQPTCSNAHEFVTAKATGGGSAIGWGNMPPTCIANGGTAMVKSSGGPCHAP